MACENQFLEGVLGRDRKTRSGFPSGSKTSGSFLFRPRPKAKLTAMIRIAWSSPDIARHVPKPSIDPRCVGQLP